MVVNLVVTNKSFEPWAKQVIDLWKTVLSSSKTIDS